MFRTITRSCAAFVIASVLFLSANLSMAQTTPTPSLPSGYDWKYNPDNGHYYAIIKNNLDWEIAKNIAIEIGGHLATFTNHEESEWIFSILESEAVSNIFIGLININDSWQWVTGETYSYQVWLPNEPSGDGSYVQIRKASYLNNTWGWNDLPSWNGENQGYIIEMEDPIQISTSTPVFSPTPSDSPSPVIPLTPTPTAELWSSLNGTTLEENQLWADAPSGFTKGKINVGEIPAGEGTDGKGVEIKLSPGQGAWIVSTQDFAIGSLALIRGSFRSSNRNGAIALIALNSPIDGQFGYTNIIGNEIPVDDYRQFNLIYRAPSGKLQIALQAVNSPYSTISSTVWIDNLSVIPFEPTIVGVPIDLQVDGNFEEGLEDILININGDDGNIIPFFESLTDVALRLSIDPEQTAANIGTTCLGLDTQFPLRLVGQVSVQRESLPSGGMAALVITNGFQNLGVFRFADQIPDANLSNPEQLMIGGDFILNNPDIPINAFVQIGGPGAEVSMVVDDLQIFKNSPYEDLPIPTPTVIPLTLTGK